MRTILWLSAVLVSTMGCSPSVKLSPAVAVAGTVSLKGKAVSRAMVQFIPTGDGGRTGTGMTDEMGHYTLVSNKGESGLPSGEYKVVITKKLGIDGNEIPAGTSPLTGGAKETLPRIYSDANVSVLMAKVDVGPTTVDFPLTGTAGNTRGGILAGGANASMR